MRRLILAIIALLSFSGCHYDEYYYPCCPGGGGQDGRGGLVSPSIYATNASDPFTGVLEVYPCDEGTSTYYGNYFNDQLMVFNAFYNIADGSVATSPRPIYLPVGKYSLLYWGVPKSSSSYPVKGVREPSLTLGADLKGQYISLRKSPLAGSDTYMPVFDCVYCLRTVDVGAESIAVPLQRVVAGLTVKLQKKDGTQLDSEISNITATIGPIASRLNFYTAEPDDFTKEVGFDLKIDQSLADAANPTVMLFPSGPSPELTVTLNMREGQKRSATMTLENTLTANTNLTVEVGMGEIFASETGGSGFEVDHWNERVEKIDSGIFQ